MTPPFPGKRSITACARAASRSSDLDFVAFYEKPFLKFDRILHSYLAYAPSGLRSFLHGHSALDSRAHLDEGTHPARNWATRRQNHLPGTS